MVRRNLPFCIFLSGILSAQIASVARNQPVARNESVDRNQNDRQQVHPQTAAAHISGYVAGPGWNACAGLGRPDGAKILAMLSGD